jgi:hypothetical protein
MSIKTIGLLLLGLVLFAFILEVAEAANMPKKERSELKKPIVQHPKRPTGPESIENRSGNKVCIVFD